MYAFVQGWPGAEVVLPALGTVTFERAVSSKNICGLTAWRTLEPEVYAGGSGPASNSSGTQASRL